MHSKSRRGRVFARWFAAVAVVSPVLLAVVAGGVPAQAAQHAASGRSTGHASYQLPAGVTDPCAAATPGHATCAALTGAPAHGAHVKAATATTPAGYAPSDLQSAYSLPKTTSLGTAETVAVVTAYDDPAAASDLGTYRSQYGLSSCTTANGCFKKVNQTGGTTYPGTSAGWSAADAQSLDMISALCPACHLLLVEANSTAITDFGTAENEAVTLGADFIDNDWITAEAGLGSSETSYDAQYFNHPGVAITAPAGNAGYSGGVNYPAASSDVTAVGGTTLTKSTGGRGWTETAWSGSGSGCSAYEPKPSWQTDTGCSDRTLNDTAAVADPGDPVAYYDTPTVGGWGEGGGTDVSAAIIAAVYALAGPPAPGTNPAAYLYNTPGALNAITSGSNGTCSPTYLCTAQPGYNGPAGLGTPAGTAAYGTYQAAFQGTNGDLWYTTPTKAGNHDTGLGMASGSSTAITASGEVAFQGTNGHLWLYDPSTGSGRDTGLSMLAKTSPAIAPLTTGGYEIAFQASTGILWLYDPTTGTEINTGLGMRSGTSPAITAVAGGSYQVAFQANNGHLYYYTPTNAGNRDTGLGMAPGTSPSIAASGEVAFQANTNHLWLYDPGTGGNRDTGLGMDPGTSPDIVSLSGGGYEMAFQANTGILWLNDPSTGKSINTGLGMAASTSPAITATADGSYEVAFQAANSGHLYYYTPTNAGNRDTGLGVAPGTSPAIG
jgi:hypothetical protein